ncbi:formyltetrahydrofolate deformylase [uncultured Mycolicibacterium sp.]|uniref:formyltetrahydrofolate deformylase n=1 Tax=uncultured Mycolicibacterium sp. TaxID=2320817 RepID=UPI00262B0A44|nr:formyltetrahydrofolate deformylase [uncultured Mycolicibacterium sp.]
MTTTDTEFILNISCKDRPGVVAGVSTFLAERNASIKKSTQFGDEGTGQFFMRVHFAYLDGPQRVQDVRDDFAGVAEQMGLDFAIKAYSARDRLLVMVSRYGHCLNDLLHKVNIGALPATIEAVVSNHEDFRGLVEWHGIPYFHIPVTPDTKPAAEDRLRELIAEFRIDTVVLARYMQILSDGLCAELAGRAINIHHSLLPSFKGARPYEQAYAKGVKVVGATAHYVTADLDEGPIIEQDFERVTHEYGPKELAAIGRDLEARALSRAVAAHADRRVMLNGRKTVVFS